MSEMLHLWTFYNTICPAQQIQWWWWRWWYMRTAQWLCKFIGYI